jgi:aquaporin Z
MMIKKLAAEFVGTLWLVLGVYGSAVLAAFPDADIGLLGVSMAFGLTVLTMAYAVGHISSAGILHVIASGKAGFSTAAGFAANGFGNG